MKIRTTEEARKALSSFCKAVGTHGDHSVHIFSIPVDEERDTDCILSDVITERDQLRSMVARLLSGIDRCNGPDDFPDYEDIREAAKSFEAIKSEEA